MIRTHSNGDDAFLFVNFSKNFVTTVYASVFRSCLVKKL